MIDPDLPPLPATPAGRYRHYKGNEYEVIGVARHSETLEPLVIYRPLYNASGLWVRPHAMFFGQVEVQGILQPRFARALRIEVDDLTRPQIHALLEEHLANMHELSPPENVFALDLSRLRAPDITFWSVWDGDDLLGCGALKELSPTEGEIKSMRTPATMRRRGAGRAMLEYIVGIARERGYDRLNLETGSHAAFEPAHKLYRSFGFTECGPFGSYEADPHSVFMTLRLNK